MDRDVLTLESDGTIVAPTLTDYLDRKVAEGALPRELAGLLVCFAETSIPLAKRLSQGCLPGDPTAVVGTNISGDKQKALDMTAHHHFLREFANVSVAKVLSEEDDKVITVDPNGLYDVAMDPLDGSGSIGIGAPLGALFCVFPKGETFLRSGRDIVAAAYVSFGHSLDFGFSYGGGVAIATLDSQLGQFRIEDTDAHIKPDSTTVAFNASNLRRWGAGLQRYVGDLIQGADGPRRRDFNMRWIAAAVGDLHRILRRSGIFMYPADSRPGYETGFLRLAYEAFPIAFLIEQAGGAATDGATPILDLTPEHAHARVPLFFGSSNEMAALQRYLSHLSS